MAIKRKPQSTDSLTVGLDIGYGVTKAIGSNDTSAVFPSVLAVAKNIRFKEDEIKSKYPGDALTDSDGDWFVGDLATSQSSGELVRLRGRGADRDAVGNAFRLRMMKASLGKLLAGNHSGDVVHITVATGLPVNHMPAAAGLKAALCGQHPIRTDSANFIANVTEVMVMPQPYGTIYARLLNEDGTLNKKHTANRTGVIDVGTYTVDAALDDDGEYIDSESGSAEIGVGVAIERVSQFIEDERGQRPSFRATEAILKTKRFKFPGDTNYTDYTQLVETSLTPMKNATLALVQEKWKAGLEVEIIYVSGGGAELVISDLKIAGYRQAQVVTDPQLANGRGYLYYANFKARE